MKQEDKIFWTEKQQAKHTSFMVTNSKTYKDRSWSRSVSRVSLGSWNTGTVAMNPDWESRLRCPSMLNGSVQV